MLPSPPMSPAVLYSRPKALLKANSFADFKIMFQANVITLIEEVLVFWDFFVVEFEHVFVSCAIFESNRPKDF